MIRVVLLVAIFGLASSKNIFEKNECPKVTFSNNECAKIFDDTHCNGDSDIILDNTDPTKTLKETDDDAESIVVRKGCALRGYEHKLSYPIVGRGEFITVTAPETENKVVLDTNADPDDKTSKDLVRDEFNEDLSSVSCVCGQNRYFPDGSQCPGVPKFLCAIAYENGKCRTAGSLGALLDTDEPLEIEVSPSGEDLEDEYEDDIESLSVRRGCKFTGYKDTGLSGESLVIDASNSRKDLHVDFDTTKDFPKAKGFKNKIESYKCTCN